MIQANTTRASQDSAVLISLLPWKNFSFPSGLRILLGWMFRTIQHSRLSADIFLHYKPMLMVNRTRAFLVPHAQFLGVIGAQ